MKQTKLSKLSPQTCTTSDGNEQWDPIFQSYKFIKYIGSGSFGDVIKAQHKKSRLEVAIKKISVKGDDYEIKKLVREVSILRQLSASGYNHFVVRIYDLIIDEKDDKMTLFIVQEYLETDLKKLLDSSSDFEMDQEHVIVFLYNLLCALNFFHTSNIMHRDIKPANLLVDFSCRVKLCDLGLTRQIPEGTITSYDLEQVSRGR